MVGANSPSQEKSIVFHAPQQMAEILNEASRLKLQVLIKYTNDGKAVRGFLERADIVGEKGIRISGISPAGDAALTHYEVVHIEFVLLSKKIYFVSKIRARTTSRILLSIPEKIFALERRSNSRFRLPKSTSAFIRFDSIKIDHSRFDAPIYPNITSDPRENTAKFLVDDISLGGAALFTRYAATAEVLKPNSKDFMATLLFPKMQPLHVPVSVRWIKKTTMRILPGKNEQVKALFAARLTPLGIRSFEDDFNEIYHRTGIQFSEVSTELDHLLREFIHLIQTANSV